MAGKWCKRCQRPDGPPYHVRGVCDLVQLSNGRTVHASRIAVDGDLHTKIGKGKDDLKVVHRFVTDEMREQERKANDDSASRLQRLGMVKG